MTHRTRPSVAVAVAVVGPCAAGKSTLTRALRSHGYPTREVAQEHSVVPDLWRRRGPPGPLVFLDVSPEVACARRGLRAPPAWWASASLRLARAREQADLYVFTDRLSPAEVVERVLAYLARYPGADAAKDTG